MAFLTMDKRTMPGHIADHLSARRHTWGVFTLRMGFSVPTLVDDLVLIWSATQAEDWQDRIEWLPW